MHREQAGGRTSPTRMEEVGQEENRTFSQPEASCCGEGWDIFGKLIVAPATGRFRPLCDAPVTVGRVVRSGQPVARIVNGGDEATVTSCWDGPIKGVLVLPEQPVRTGEGLFWLGGT